MKVWSVTYESEETYAPNIVQWFTTKAQMSKRVKELQENQVSIGDYGWVDIPTDKTGLCDWLNINADKDPN